MSCKIDNDIPVENQFPEIRQVTEPRGLHRVDSRAVENQPVESQQTAKRGGLDDVHVTIVKGQATQMWKSTERVVGYRVEARHRELDPFGLVGQLVEVAQVAVNARVGDRPLVLGDQR